jgi:hypothetical protein
MVIIINAIETRLIASLLFFAGGKRVVIASVSEVMAHLQNLVFCEKARSASIFVAVCVSAR